MLTVYNFSKIKTSFVFGQEDYHDEGDHFNLHLYLTKKLSNQVRKIFWQFSLLDYYDIIVSQLMVCKCCG